MHNTRFAVVLAVLAACLSGGAGCMAPWTLAIGTLRKQGIAIFTQPPTGDPTQTAILPGGFV